MTASTAPHAPSPPGPPGPPGTICPRCRRTLDAEALRCPYDGSEVVRCEGELEPGSTLKGRYLLGEVIGTGGWGVVYRARDLRDGSDAAVKVLSAAHASDPGSITRFLREQQIISRLNHPHVVAQRQRGRTEHGLYIAMELLVGKTLGLEIHQHAPLPFGRAARIAAQICEALYAAHSRGVIHRDLKPDNVFLTESLMGRDYVKVMDFGIAKLMADDESDSGTPRLIYGTPHYLSPEQARGDHIDGRSDLYSAGVVLFEMLTGQMPFPREDALLALQRRVDQDAPDLRHFPDLNIPNGLCDVVRSMLARDPAGRPRNAAEARELLAEFDELATPRPAPVAPPLDTPVTATLHNRFAALDYAPRPVGRDAERRQLEALVDTIHEHSAGRTVLMAGPTGIGKSQLCALLCERALERQVGVVSVECRAGHPALYPVVVALEELLGVRRLDARATRQALRSRFTTDELGSEAMADELCALLRPESAALPAGAAAPREIRLHLVLSTLSRIASRRPLLLVLEDLHRADALTVALMAQARVSFREAGRGLLLLGLWTTGEAGEALPAPWRRIDERFADRAMLIELQALDGAKTDELLRAIGPIDEPSRRYIARLAQGNPLAALQIVRHLKNERLLIHGYHGWQLAPGAHLERSVPPAMDDFARMRLERLRKKRGAGERAAELLERLSLCGDRVPMSVLRQALDIEGRARVGDVLPDLLDVLAGGGFIRPGDWTDEGEVVFEQALIGQAIAKGFEERADTRATHLAIAEAMIESGGGGDRAIAMHLLSGGAAERAAPFALRAAASARAATDLSGAADDFRLALRALEAMPFPSRDSWIEARLGLGEVLLLLGQALHAEAEFRAVLDREDHPAAWLGLGRVAEATGAAEIGLEALPRAADLSGRAGRPTDRAQALLLLGKMRVWRGDFDAARRDYEEALGLLVSSLDRTAYARALIALAGFHKWTGHAERGLNSLHEAAAIAEAVKDANLLGECLYQIGTVHVEQDDFQGAIATLDRAADLFSRTGHLRGLRACWATSGGAHLELGSFAEAERLLSEALVLAEESDNRLAVATTMCDLSCANRRASRFDHAADWASRTLELAAQLGAKSIVPVATCNLAYARLGLGAVREAQSLFLDALANPELRHRQVELGECLQGLGDIARLDGNPGEAHRLYERARDMFHDARRPSYEATVVRKLEEIDRLSAES